MKDPARLLDGDGSEMERLLLSAGEAEEPTSEGPRRLATALGLAIAPVSVVGAGASGSPSGGGAALSGGGASVAPPALAGSALAAKWLALVVAVGAGVAVGVGLQSRDPESADTQVTPTEAQNAPAAVEAEKAAPAEPPEAPAAVAAQPAQRAVAMQSSRRADPDKAPSIAGEIRQLDKARRSLASGDPAGALGAIDAYKRANPAGVLRQEATLLQIEALARSGNRVAARDAAKRFLRNNPSTPHENRILALVGDVR
jgi:hypothetical protein